MFERLNLENFTLFKKAELSFSHGINVFVGENGTGKTHLLKLLYSIQAVSAEEGKKLRTIGERSNEISFAKPPTKNLLEPRLSDKIINVFRAESLGKLVSRGQGNTKSRVDISFENSQRNMSFDFSNNSKSINMDKLPEVWDNTRPVFLPTRELLTIYPGFVSLYEERELDFDETFRDTCLLLGTPVRRRIIAKSPSKTPQSTENELKKRPTIKKSRNIPLSKPLEDAIHGKVVLEKGRMYLGIIGTDYLLEISLASEGFRKLATLSRLIDNGTLSAPGYLFWDEPEANLNPALIRVVAKSILGLAQSGIQIFIATHSLFLLREIDILVATDFPDFLHRNRSYFGLQLMDDRMARIEQGKDANEIGDITALDEAIKQSDRYMAID